MAGTIMDTSSNFLLCIKFPVNSGNPQHVFHVASIYIEALLACDDMLLKSFPAKLRPTFTLEQVGVGSLKMVLRQFVEGIDDDAIKGLDWKPAVGKFLVRAKYWILKKLEGQKSLPDWRALAELSEQIHRLAMETDVLHMPAYLRITEVELAKQAKKFSAALAAFEADETVSFDIEEGSAVMDRRFSVTDADIDAMLTAQTLTHTNEIILKVRKPDFLGESRWEFRHKRQNMSISIQDKDWLGDFQAGKVDIRPGDALQVMLEETTTYDAHGEVVSEVRQITKVLAVIRRQEQASLL